MNRSTVTGIPAGTEASESIARMCSSRSYPILGNDWISLATIVGVNPAPSSFANAVFRPRNAKIVMISRPPGRRCRRAPAITRSNISQPSEPALGGWTASGTRNRQPRQANRKTPGSSLSKDAPEVEAERFLELGPRSCRGLRVFELFDVELERNSFAFHAVELRGEPAALVR